MKLLKQKKKSMPIQKKPNFAAATMFGIFVSLAFLCVTFRKSEVNSVFPRIFLINHSCINVVFLCRRPPLDKGMTPIYNDDDVNSFYVILLFFRKNAIDSS